MSMFVSRHERFLEAELIRVRADHERHISDLRNTYEMLLNSAIEETRRLRDDNARLQRVAVPEVKDVRLPGDPEPPAPPMMLPAKPRTFQEVVNQTVASWEKHPKHIGHPGQPITPQATEAVKETEHANG